MPVTHVLIAVEAQPRSACAISKRDGLDDTARWKQAPILSNYTNSLSCCISPRPGVHKVEQFGGGARHAAVFTGKSRIFISSLRCRLP